MESLESILSDLQGKYKDPETSKQGKDEKPTPQSPSQNNILSIAPAANSLDNLLNDLRNNSQSKSQNYVPDYQSQQVIPEVKQNLLHQWSIAIYSRLQISKKPKIKKRSQNRNWMVKKLDPLGGEGLWFEEFAKNYPSRLEAAIALLQSQ